MLRINRITTKHANHQSHIHPIFHTKINTFLGYYFPNLAHSKECLNSIYGHQLPPRQELNNNLCKDFYCEFFEIKFSDSRKGSTTDLHIYNLDMVPPIHVVSNQTLISLPLQMVERLPRVQPVSVANHVSH